MVEDSWSKVKEHFLKMKDVQKFGESLKINKKIFVMIIKGKFVLRLPEGQVTSLIKSGKGEPYDWWGDGNISKDWVIIPIKFKEKLIDLASEAKDYVINLAKKE